MDLPAALVPPLSFPLTPFTDDDRFAADVFAAHVDQQIAAGTSAVFVACGTGEFTALGRDEYREVLGVAVRTAAGRVPVFAGAGGGPAAARACLADAADCGAEGVLLLPPYLVSSTPRGVLGHIRYVVHDSPLPVIVYQRANARLDPATALALLDLEQVVGLKDGLGDIEHMQRIVATVRTSGHPRAAGFAFLNGLPTAELSARAYRAIGVGSYSSAVHAFAPDLAHAFARALDSGDDARVDALLAAFLLPLADLRDTVPGYAVSLVKAGARLEGIPVGPVRPPLVEALPEHVEQLARIIAAGRAVLA
ncbi:5-dehydro-4-deoxyglucarate dehydratase [Streptacidiphilus sp. PB12-B1b]|uniref:5-dehydro-4-deoxyglucarate dehydratase n=1 Tax=Streptacidiphilus sp. PB12-B1b TaxID=2705012 RepID=UPI001CDC560C|nr:5-dehydro-4-deoxyglucarate dehydratase [Streptacidiphilus sp. PB12-B1b]